MRVGQIRIRFDCGCNENIDKNLLEIVKNEALKADYILLSHATCMHVGALAYLNAKGVHKEVIGTSPVAKLGAQTMHELYIQKKESPELMLKRVDGSLADHASSWNTPDNKPKYVEFDHFTLQNVEEGFEKIELVSYQERRRLSSGDTEVILKALPSGNSVGGTAWHLEYNKLSIIYALDLNDKETPISLPLQFPLFKGANLMITNGYI